jgi:PiT family inorganic phosphate transporter
VAVNLPLVLGAAILFGLGTAVGVRRLAARLGRKLFLVRPLNIVVAGYAAGLAVLASAAAGAPVSMSHATTAGLVGSEVVLETYRRVRWEQVIRVGATWVTTVPGAVILAAVVAAVVR